MDETVRPAYESLTAAPSPDPHEPRERQPGQELTSGAGASQAAWYARLLGGFTFLNNRFILASLSLVVVLLLTAAVFAAIGNGARRMPLVVVRPTPTPTTGAPALALDGGLPGRILYTVSVRNGPNAFLLTSILGTVPRGTMIAVVGRNAEQTWLQIVYPPDSVLRGWVDARYIAITGDVSRLPLAGPGPRPEVAVPTSAAQPGVHAAPPTVPPPTAVQPSQTPFSLPTHTPPLRPTATSTAPTRVRTTPTPQRTATPPQPATGTPHG